nr:MAG TPA: hypothetical protein [Bacteriophage sp.]
MRGARMIYEPTAPLIHLIKGLLELIRRKKGGNG